MRCKAWLLAALLLASGGGHALELRLDPAGLDPHQQQQAQDLLAHAQAALPERWRTDSRRLSLRFDPRLPANVAGRHRHGDLRLSPQLLQLPLQVLPQLFCQEFLLVWNQQFIQRF